MAVDLFRPNTVSCEINSDTKLSWKFLHIVKSLLITVHCFQIYNLHGHIPFLLNWFSSWFLCSYI